MRHFGFAVALVVLSAMAGGIASAAEIQLPPPHAVEKTAIQQGPPNCVRWTDDCVNCSRQSADDAPVCSNIGVACQPKAIRCLSPAPPIGAPAR